MIGIFYFHEGRTSAAAQEPRGYHCCSKIFYPVVPQTEEAEEEGNSTRKSKKRCAYVCLGQPDNITLQQRK